MYERYSWFCAARPRSAWSTSRSVRPGGSPSGRRRRMSSGTTASMNASSDSYPRVASMPRVSSGLGPMCRVTKRSAGASEARTVGICGMVWSSVTLLPDLLLIPLVAQQLVELRRSLRAQFDHPARASGIAIDDRRVALERFVHVGHRARAGRVQLRHRLHRLDLADPVSASK